MFSAEELAYLRSQPLARLATVTPDGQPTVDAVGFQFDGDRFIIGGHNLSGSRKYRNVAAGNHQVALIIDDLAATDPWTPRGIKVHGVAEIVTRNGYFGPGDYVAITPEVAWSWGVVAPAFGAQGAAWNKTVWPRA
ncbi:MAG: PPOX class F420-dependent oxidoreductase [Thermomicrobiales bacterium]|nr:PPOX class F420-dependent oxidoreductase [Thermomicrobiales bacterium]